MRVSPCGFPGTVQSYGKTSLSVRTRFENGGIKFTALPVDAGGLTQGVAQTAGSVLYYDAMVLPTLLDETLPDVPSDPLPTANATQAAKLHLVVSRRGLVMSVDGSIAVYPLELGDDEPYTTNWCVCAGYRTGSGIAVTNFMLQAADGGVLPEATSDWHRLTLGRKIIGHGAAAAIVFEVYIDGVRAAAEDGTTDFLALATKPTGESCFMRFVGMGTIDNLEISVAPRDFSHSSVYLLSDGMPDTNCDGVPDVCVDKYGLAENYDEDVHALNDDGDYLLSNTFPYLGCQSGYGYLIPELENLFGEPFDASLEIRGFGAALNDAPQQLGIKGVTPVRIYTDPEVDPDSTLSKLEYLAWTDFKSANPSATVEDWSPERPTDPMTDDTDGDGIKDGVEYAWWYQAHVGCFDYNGVHVYAQGRRYDPRNPGGGRLIAREEIERIMDPLVAVSDPNLDSDNDGLPDLLEVELGTNPFDFDTDGDGLPDGYEIMFSWTDPLRVCTASGIKDSLRNSDGDAMAFSSSALERCVLPEPTNICEWTTFSVLAADGDSDGVQWYATREFPSVDYLVETQFVKVFETSSGRICTTAPVRVSEDGVLLTGMSRDSAGDLATFEVVDTESQVERFPALAGCSAPYLRLEPVSIAPGVQLQKISGNAYVIETSVATLSFASSLAGCNSAWIYGRALQDEDAFGMLALGRYLDVPKGAVLSSLPETSRQVVLLHYLVYQEFRFDPRTAWNPNTPLSSRWANANGDDDGSILAVHQRNYMGVSTRTRPFTTYDEFLLLSFFLNNGVLADSDVTPSADRGWNKIWGVYTTDSLGPADQESLPAADYTEKSNGLNGADTDRDGVPDGWELYVMGGPKDERTGRFVFAAPYGDGVRSSHGPFMSYAGMAQYDIDVDGLTELQEYSGLDSSAYYGDVQKGEDAPYSSTIGSVGQSSCGEKYYPTDPWQSNVGDVGVLDGAYLLECDGKWWDVEVKNGEASVCGCYEDGRRTLAAGDARIPSEIGGRSVTGISASAFAGNFGLTSVTIPASVREIEEGAFAWCDVGLSVDAENRFFRVEQGALFTIDGKTLLYWPPDRRIGIPDGVCRIGVAAFAGNRSSGGMSISIPSSVVSIGVDAFECVGLSEVNFGEGLAAIEDGAFGCNDFNACVLPGTLQDIGAYAFGSCTNLVSVTFEGDMPTNVSANAFCQTWQSPGDRVDDVVQFYAYDDTTGWPIDGWWLGRRLSFVPRGYTISFVTEYGGPVASVVRKQGEVYGALPALRAAGRCFVGWCREPNGRFLVRPDEFVCGNETLYARWTFSAVVDGLLWSYDIGETGEAILQPAVVPGVMLVPTELEGHDVRNIPDLCFAHSSNLVSVVIPSSVTNIGNYAFYDCPNLRSVSFSEGLVSIGSGAFAACTGLGEIVLPQTLKVLGQEVAVRNENVYTVEESHYEFATNYMIVTTNGESVTTEARDESSFSSSSSIRSVGKGVFEGCSSLTNIVMQEGLRAIGAGAFFNCQKLQSLVVPDSVLRIGGYAESCQSSESDSFFSMSVMDRLEQQGRASTISSDSCQSRESQARRVSVETHGFCENCTSLASILLPSGLRYLGAHAFSGCERLKSVSLPDGLTTIMEGTFSGCKRLADVCLPANLELVGGVEWFPSESIRELNTYDALAQNGGAWSVLTTDSYVSRQVKDGMVVTVDSLSHNEGTPSVLSNAVDLVEFDSRWKPDCGDWICPVDANCEQWLYNTTEINCIEALGGCLKDEDWDRMRRVRSALHPSSADYAQMNDGNSRQHWAGAFEGCYSLRNLVLPRSVRRIAPYSFYDCVNLASIVIPDGIQALGYDAFGGETSFMDIQTPWLNYGDLYEVFPSHAFVTNLVLTSSPKRIDDCEDVYRWMNGMYAAGLAVTSQELDDVITRLVTEHWISSGPILAGFRRLKSLTLPEGLERFDQSIGWYEAENLRRVFFPHSLRALGRHAFLECPLKEVVLPANLDAVGDYAFAFSDILRVTFQGNAPSDVSPNLFVGEDDWGYYDMADENLQVCVYPGTTGWDGWQETGGLPDDGLWPTEAAVFKRRSIRYVDQPLASIVGGTGSEDAYSFYDTDKQQVVSVPQSWLSDHGLLGVTSSGGAALLTLSPISTRTIYQSYAAGLDPTDATDEFKATIEIVDGEAKISWSPKLSAGEELLRTYTTYGCRNIGGAWVDMDAVPAAEKADYKFFKVTVEMR